MPRPGPAVVPWDVEALTSAARRLADDSRPKPGRARGRRLLGLVGAPGAGKSTLAAALADRLGDAAAVVPMDGFHLGDALLRRLGLRDRKGAPETFDADGFAVALSRLRAADRVVYLPEFDRGREDSTAAALAIAPDVPLLIVEGNYLLHWRQVRVLLDEAWFLDPPADLRRQRLLARHLAHGRSEDEARAFALGSDERNARLIEAGRDLADLVVRP